MEYMLCSPLRRSLLRVAILFLALWPVLLPAQTTVPNGDSDKEPAPESEVDPDLISPRATLTTFLKAVEAAEGSDDEQQWEKVFKTLEIPKSAGDARRDAALRLKQVLNRLGEMDPAVITPDSEETAEERLERFELFPDNPKEGARLQFGIKVRNPESPPPGSLILANDPELGWRFNAESIEAINPLFGWLEEIGVISFEDEKETPLADIIRSRVPDWTKRGFFLGMEVWQWILITLILLLSVAIYWLGTVVFAALIKLGSSRFEKVHAHDERRRVARPFSLILGAVSFILMLKWMGIIGTALAVLLLAGRLVLTVGITWTAWATVNFLTNLWDRYTTSTETTFDDMLVPLVRKTLKLIIIVWAIIYVAASIDILNFVTPILAGFGLAGLAISFAAQDLIKNLFGGVTIFLDGPFQVGERIIFEGYDGVVEGIGFRSTRLRTKDGHLVSVPNGAITNHCVENIGRRPSIRRDIQLGITYDTKPEQIREAIRSLHAILKDPEIAKEIHPQFEGDSNLPRVFFEEFADSALVIRVLYWYASADFWAYIEHSQEINLRIMEKFAELKIDFAFPTQTIHLPESETRLPGK